MNKPILKITCIPTRETYTRGEALPVRFEIQNLTSNPVELLAAGVPWYYHHSVRFSLSSYPEGAETLENRLWVMEPPSTPYLPVAPGQTISGEVDLASYLYTKDGRSIKDIPGSYTLTAGVLTFVATPGSDEKPLTLKIETDPFTILIR